MAHDSSPTLFTIPPGVPFLDALAQALVADPTLEGTLSQEPEELADLTILLPTRRAVRSLTEAFLRAGDGRPILLPHIRPLGDVDEDELLLTADPAEGLVGGLDLPPAIEGMDRQLRLARLVLAWGRGSPFGPKNAGQATALAAELAHLIDSAETEGIDLSKVKDLVPDRFAEHWQHTLSFLEIALDYWPRELAERGLIDPAKRRNLTIRAEVQAWATKPPAHPVIAAGSTGSIPATAELLKTVACLPKGALILPGLDQTLDARGWHAVGPSHPQYGMKQLLASIGVGRDQVQSWPHASPKTVASERAAFLSEALRPAETTDAWSGADAQSFDAAAATTGLTLIEAPTPREEAAAIACALREVLEEPARTGVLVTPDRSLARRVAQDLGRWNIPIDDSAGMPLGGTVPFGLLRLLAVTASEGLAPVSLLDVLKHPLTALGLDPQECARRTRELERLLLRGPRPGQDIAGLRDVLVQTELEPDQREHLTDLVDRLDAAITPFLDLYDEHQLPLERLAEAHVKSSEALATSDAAKGADRLYLGDAGEATALFMETLLASAESLVDMEPLAYLRLLETLSAGRMVRPRFGQHPRLSILGPLEARLLSADRVILGGLNEESWPTAAPIDAWLSRPMREDLGLEPPERRIGLSAHDFVQAACGGDVIITRSLKVEGAPTVASRWLLRIDSLLKGAGRDEGLTPDPAYLDIAEKLDAPAEIVPAPAPQPKPPLAARPNRYSATEVETLIRDPYAIYAKKVLRLKPLDPLDADAGALERGTLLHQALENFARAFPDTLPSDVEAAFLEMGKLAFEKAPNRPGVTAFWWPRYEEVARWMANWESELRKEVERTHAEIKGELALQGFDRAMILSARADRIDERHDGSFAIYDYKTGTPPSKKQVEAGLSPQLPLEAAIAAAGGFATDEGKPLGARAVSDLSYLHLSGGNPGAAEKNVSGDGSANAADILAGLVSLLQHYESDDTPHCLMSTPGALTVDDTTRRQAAAADPDASVWVSANAGSGKTHVLINRVIRLLLSGTDPERILCLTFTKAAASEMAGRLYDRLGEWAVMEETALAEKLNELEGKAPDAAKLLSARLLFARAIETPGGLKIQTIHAFCERLLGRFPLEAGVPPHFEILDERTAAELMAEARDEILLEIGDEEQAGTETDLSGAFETVTSLVGEFGFDDLFREIVGKRARLTETIARVGGVDGILDQTAKLLGLSPEDTEESLAAAAGDAAPITELKDTLPLLQGGNKTDIKTADAIAAFLQAPKDIEVLDVYKTAFLKQDGDPKKLTPSIITKKVHEAHPYLLDLLEQEQARIIELEERRRAARIMVSTHALYVLAAALLARFEALKSQWAVLDYEDLILKSRDLLNRSSAAAWVLYKLDGGLEHILVDEAQDTSPHQWQVIQALAEEFLSGEGARDLTRTIFAVGDEKQSIFSFQGADPAKFAEMKTHFATKVEGAGKAWNPVDLLLSFRSTREILSAVDQVFATEVTATGLNADAEPPTHYPFRDLDAGLVEIWPTCVPDEEEEALPWDAPLDYPNAQSPEARLAERVASTIAHWLASKEVLQGEGRPITAGDVLILVRRRNTFVEEVIRALKHRNVPVAGTDRMVLTDQIAVMDLMAAAAFALLPEDDLTLATVLKSPLIGFDEDALFELAHDRDGTLWQALASRQHEQEQFREAHTLLSSWRTRADQVRPYEFFAQLLIADGGRLNLRARLGADVDDPVDEFLSLALGYERTHTPSLQSFLHWVEAGEAEVKREMAEGREEVRIMTVHGAKGLEAPIVFLPDTCSVPGGQHDPKLLPVDAGGAELLLFPGRKANDDPVAGAARDHLRTEAMNEYRRLLYVAMTRAKDRLYVCGYEGVREPSPDCWYRLIENGLAADMDEVLAWDGETVRRMEGEQKRAIKPATVAPQEQFSASLPAWATQAPAPEPVPPKPLAPSKLVEEADEPSVASPLSKGGADRFKRGRLIHRLLETLPDLAEETRSVAAKRFLANEGLALSGDEQAEIAGAVERVLSVPDFAPLFGPGSRAEVSLVGEIESGGERLFLSGQIDRLLVSETEVLIVDYKTNRPPPSRIEEASPAYIAQMAGYAALLAKLHPDRPIRAALLWTDGPNLMEIPAEMLAKAL
eukprot:s1_g1477.t1